jgi:hypothetical protein
MVVRPWPIRLESRPKWCSRLSLRLIAFPQYVPSVLRSMLAITLYSGPEGCRAFAADKFLPSRHLIDIDIFFLTKDEALMKLGQ